MRADLPNKRPGKGGGLVSREAVVRLRLGLVLLLCSPVFLFLLLPSLVIVPMALTRGDLLRFPPDWISVHSFVDYLQDPQWVEATVTSFKVALLAVPIACIAGATAALALSNMRGRFRSIVTGVILLPLVVPLVVLGIADYILFARLDLVGGWIGIGLAHGLLTTPLVFVAVETSLAGLDPSLVRSARSLGADEWNVFLHVFLPVIRPGLAAGAVFAFAVSFDEVVVAYFLQGTSTITLPVKMFTSLQYDLSPKIAAVASLLLALGVGAVLTQFVLERRSPAP